MSDFVFVIPQGWTQIPVEYVYQIGPAAIENYVASGLSYLEQELIAAGALPAGTTVSEARFFNGEVLVVRLG